MTIEIKHKFTNPKADGPDATIVRPSNWNDNHDITLAASRLLGRAAASAGSAQEVSLGTGLSFSGTVMNSDPGGVFHAAAAEALLVPDDEIFFWDTSAGVIKKITADNFWNQMKWRATPIGGLYAVDVSMTGEEIPPSGTTDTVWLRLTAAAGFNSGKLSGETTSGTSPNISSFATIAYAPSPLNGNVIRLINTERRFLRPGQSGTLENSQNLSHNHGLDGVYTAGSSGSTNWSADGPVNNKASRNTLSDGGDEARPRNIGIDYYMRIA